MSNKKNLFGTV